MTDDAPTVALPTADDWARVGLSVGAELRGGHQSSVLCAEHHHTDLAVKLSDRRFVDDAYLPRLELLEALASTNPNAVGPVRIGGQLAVEVGEFWAVAYPFEQGRQPVLTDRADVTSMASTLASLHRSLRELAAPDVPIVAALRGIEPVPDGFGPAQLLHGDYADSNLLLTDHGARALDFDDAGYGPIEFEIGNTLYMVLFDATMHDRLDVYGRFRPWFVEAYDGEAGTTLDPATLDSTIALRIRALSGWLDDLPNAPIGIRSASPQWRRDLRRFVVEVG